MLTPKRMAVGGQLALHEAKNQKLSFHEEQQQQQKKQCSLALRQDKEAGGLSVGKKETTLKIQMWHRIKGEF